MTESELKQRRSHTDKTMWLPNGRTCSDCGRFRRCQAFGLAKADNVTCDFAPSLFVIQEAATGK